MSSLSHIRPGRSAQLRASMEAREAACNLHARRLYRDVLLQMDGLTYEQQAAHLNEIGAPRLRGSDPWTADAVATIRARVAALKI